MSRLVLLSDVSIDLVVVVVVTFRVNRTVQSNTLSPSGIVQKIVPR